MQKKTNFQGQLVMIVLLSDYSHTIYVASTKIFGGRHSKMIVYGTRTLIAKLECVNYFRVQ